MRIGFRGGWKEALLLVVAFLLFLIVLALPLVYAISEAAESELTEALESGRLVRMHVVAHSNAPRDQAVKHMVRKAVMEVYGERLSRAAACGAERLMEILALHRSGIEHLAESTARRCGFQGAVRAEVGLLELPAKVCGSAVLPAGRYQALRITLGSGEGENWWCVLYPRLSQALSESAVSEPSLSFRWNTADIFSRWLLFSK